MYVCSGKCSRSSVSSAAGRAGRLAAVVSPRALSQLTHQVQKLAYLQTQKEKKLMISMFYFLKSFTFTFQVTNRLFPYK